MADITLNEPIAVPHKYRNRFLRDVASSSRKASSSSSSGNGSTINPSSYLRQDVFDEMFEKYNLDDGTWVIKAKKSLFSVGGLTAYGIGTDSGGSGVSSFAELTEVKGTSPAVNQVWGVTAIADDGTVSYGWLTQSGGGGTTYEAGVGINIDGTTINAYTHPNQDALDPNDNRVYYICVDTSGYLAVKVPWTSGEGGDTYTAGNYITIDSSNAINVDLQGIYDTNTFAPYSHTHDMADINDLEDALSDKQNVISDLTTIRSNAANGQSAYTTIQGYGDIVTRDASEFLASDALSGYATQDWVEDKGYLTSSAISGMLTTSNYASTLDSVYAAKSHTHSQYLTSSTFNNKTISLWGNTVSINGGSTSATITTENSNDEKTIISQGAIKMYHDTPFIDFYAINGGSYNVRLINSESGVLEVAGTDAALKIGSAYLRYDSTYNCLYVCGEDGAPVNFAALGGVTAYGLNSGAVGSLSNLTVTNTVKASKFNIAGYHSIYSESDDDDENLIISAQSEVQIAGDMALESHNLYIRTTSSTTGKLIVSSGSSAFIGGTSNIYNITSIYVDGSYVYMKINGKTYKLQPTVTPY